MDKHCWRPPNALSFSGAAIRKEVLNAGPFMGGLLLFMMLAFQTATLTRTSDDELSPEVLSNMSLAVNPLKEAQWIRPWQLFSDFHAEGEPDFYPDSA